MGSSCLSSWKGNQVMKLLLENNVGGSWEDKNLLCHEIFILLCVCSLGSNSVTSWTVACQAPVHGIFQAGILGWVAIFFLRKIFLTQGLNSHLLHGQASSLPLCPLGCKFFLSRWSQGLKRLCQSPFPFQTSALHVREKGKEKLKKCACMLSFFYLVLLFMTPMDCSPPGSSVHGILQARITESVAIASSRGSSQPRDQTLVSSISCIGRWVLYH